jgi:flagellar biosynthesis protein FliR
MTLLETQLSGWLADFFWPLVRISALFSAAPVLSARQLEPGYRVLLAVLVTLVAAPLLPRMPVVEALSAEAFILMLQQVTIGLMMGFSLQLVFGALVFGGQLIAYKMGLGFASLVDPANGVQTPVVAQVFVLLATLLFLVTNSHLILLQLVVDSFRTLPVGESLASLHLWNLVAWGSRLFQGGLLMALPVVGTLLLVDLGMGVLARAAPQFNLFSVGFPISILLGFVILWISMPSILEVFLELLDEVFHLLSGFVGITA